MNFPVWAIYVLLLIGSYLVGSFPTGWVLGKIIKGIDIRDFGSGNTGFSNVYRLLGKGPASLTIIGDVFIKGGLLAWVARIIVGFLVISPEINSGFIYTLGYTQIIPQTMVVLAGLLSIIGHNYPIWLNFKGGKGMATTAGVFINFVPIACSGLIIVWFIIVITTRYTSLANVVTTPTLPVFIFLETYFIMKFDIYTCLPLMIGGLIAGILVLLRHRENIKRLITKEERKFGDKSERLILNEENELTKDF
ncbi:MAG: glycerol-3-phosphate 1-O-acyltransferase PlsY [Asgard group archaeon]|nr:glycerol-3-phosphate 1-O-acyltransferase PlsY [Asgard group archaeon]